MTYILQKVLCNLRLLRLTSYGEEDIFTSFPVVGGAYKHIRTLWTPSSVFFDDCNRRRILPLILDVITLSVKSGIKENIQDLKLDTLT